MKKSPVCFIAMAFGKDDSDLFYEKQLLPVLKRNGIKPVIINRIESNDDLNLQIFGQLDKADFCIADLTYTRPSVYFEAGYAQRAIPVIYTARRDHLGKGQPEDLRVHFDLQMKNIVAWASVDDRSFAKRLDKRIKATFLREWLKTQTLNSKYESDERKFQELSNFERHNSVRSYTMSALKKLGYKESSWHVNKRIDSRNYSTSSVRGSVKNGSINYMVGYRVNKKKLYITSVQSFLSPSKNELIKLEEVSTDVYPLSDPLRSVIKDGQYKEIYMNVIILSLNSLSANRIESVLPYLIPVENSKHYKETIAQGSRTIFAEFYFLSGIKSLLRLKEQLLELKDNSNF